MTELEELRLAYAECSRQRNELLAIRKQSAQEPDPDALTAAYMSGVYEGKKRKPWVGLTYEEAVKKFTPVSTDMTQVKELPKP
jgi:hypothetical protein